MWPKAPNVWRMPYAGTARMADFDALDRRVASALQVDGRASWSSIAHALGESERTVLRRGRRLLESGAVTVAARPVRGSGSQTAVVEIECEPGLAQAAARALALRTDSVMVHLVTGSVDCVVVLQCARARLAELVLEDLPGIRGIARTRTHAVLRTTRTIADWNPGVLTDDEVAALSPASTEPAGPSGSGVTGRADELLLLALAQDGRTMVEELGRLTGVSDATVRRRIAALRATGVLAIRAVVDPALFGLGVEAVLRIEARPGSIDAAVQEIGRSHFVRYVAVTTGRPQLLVLTATPDEESLYQFTTAAPWLAEVVSVETSLMLATVKRGGVPATGAPGR